MYLIKLYNHNFICDDAKDQIEIVSTQTDTLLFLITFFFSTPLWYIWSPQEVLYRDLQTLVF